MSDIPQTVESSTDLQKMSIEQLKKELLKGPLYEPPTEHVFHGGMYCRQVWRPAGTMIIGKVHKKEHFYMVVTGTVLITTDQGAFELTAPYLLASKPGTQRAVYAVTDALCMTFHRVDSTDLEEVENDLVEQDPESPYGIGNKLKVEYLT